ncbi:MAG: hypothetical protein AAB669_02180 [Patescibacteria group bacterium]
MENEKGPSPQEDLGESKQEVSGSKLELEEGADQHAEELRRHLDTENWSNLDLMDSKSELKSCNEAVKQLDENIRIIGSTRIDSDLFAWKNVGERQWSPDSDRYRRDYDRKQYVSESLAELEKLREKLIKELEHRRDDFQTRAHYAEESIEKEKLEIKDHVKGKHEEEFSELQNAEWKPVPVEDGAEPAPAEDPPNTNEKTN